MKSADQVGRNFDDYARTWRPNKYQMQVGGGATGIATEASGDLVLPGDEWGKQEELMRPYRAFIERYLDRPSNFLEIGAGAGRLTGPLLDGFDALIRSYEAVDVSREMLDHLVERIGSRPKLNVRQIEGASDMAHYADSHFDMVISQSCWSHVNMYFQYQYLRDLRRVIRKHGVLLVNGVFLMGFGADWSYLLFKKRILQLEQDMDCACHEFVGGLQTIEMCLRLGWVFEGIWWGGFAVRFPHDNKRVDYRKWSDVPPARKTIPIYPSFHSFVGNENPLEKLVLSPDTTSVHVAPGKAVAAEPSRHERLVAPLERLTREERLRLDERFTPAQSDFTDKQLPNLPTVPGMISPYECHYLYWLVARGYLGRGAVVEIGTWLGRSSVHLGAGLRDSGHPTTLTCIDRYVWHDAFDTPRLRTNLSLKGGDDFQPYFEANVRPVYDDLNVVKAGAQNVTWDGGPIEILIIDAPKAFADVSHVLARFCRHLVPGLSVVVMQDYLHAPSYALATIASALSDQLELLHVVLHSSMVAFKVRKALDFTKPLPEWDFSKWSKEEIFKAWDRILEPLAPQPRSFIAPGLSMLLYDIGAADEAVALISDMAFAEEGRERWKFLANVPQYYDRYKPIFDAST